MATGKVERTVSHWNAVVQKASDIGEEAGEEEQENLWELADRIEEAIEDHPYDEPIVIDLSADAEWLDAVPVESGDGQETWAERLGI